MFNPIHDFDRSMAEYFDLSLVKVAPGKPGFVLTRLQVLGDNVSHAIGRAKSYNISNDVLVLQTQHVNELSA